MARFNIPPLTRALVALLTLQSITAMVIFYKYWASSQTTPPPVKPDIPWLTIAPSHLFLYPWVYVTASFVETNLFALLVSTPMLLLGGRYLERAWSSRELGKFLLVVTLVPNITATIINSILIPLTNSTGDRWWIADVSIHGGIAVQTGFLVAFKQLVPEHTVTILKGVIKMRVKHFPAVALLCNTIIAVLFASFSPFSLCFLGFLSSWTYLRFYKVTYPDLTVSQQSSLRGDASETFAFAYFFPEPLQSPIAAMADTIFQLLVSIKVCTPFSAADVETSNSQATSRGEGGLMGRSGGAQGSSRAEADRRRALALKALDQRLSAATSKTQSNITPAAPSGPSILGETTYNPENGAER